MKRAFFVLLLIFTIASTSIGIRNASASVNPWTTRTPIPTAIAGLEAAVTNGKIYAFRGSITYENDPGGMWTNRSSMPTWRHNVAVASYQNEIYVIGGATNDSAPTGTNELYDPANDSWETMISMPTPRHSLDANVVNGKIYLIGGLVQHHAFPNAQGTYEATNVTEVYDPTTDSWTTKAPIPNAVNNYASAVVNNKIYIISETLTQIYNPDNDAWSYGTPPPYQVDMAGGAATTGALAPQRIYVIGGRQSGLETNYNQVYDPATDSWSIGTAMPTSRYDLGVATVNDVIYAFGGMSGSFVVTEQKNQNEQYNPLEDTIVPATSPSKSPTPSPNPTTSPSPSSSQTPSPSPSSSSPSPSASFSEQPTPTQPVLDGMQPDLWPSVIVVVVVGVLLVLLLLALKKTLRKKASP